MSDNSDKHDFKLTEEEWRKRLSDEEYRILRQKGTEQPFTGKYYQNKETGIYSCAACGASLFDSQTKYDSKSGWPSFYKPMAKERVQLEEDHAFGMERTEVLCSRCHSHLGHVFDDGPQPTGKRYCINSASLSFEKKKSS